VTVAVHVAVAGTVIVAISGEEAILVAIWSNEDIENRSLSLGVIEVLHSVREVVIGNDHVGHSLLGSPPIDSARVGIHAELENVVAGVPQAAGGDVGGDGAVKATLELLEGILCEFGENAARAKHLWSAGHEVSQDPLKSPKKQDQKCRCHLLEMQKLAGTTMNLSIRFLDVDVDQGNCSVHHGRHVEDNVGLVKMVLEVLLKTGEVLFWSGESSSCCFAEGSPRCSDCWMCTELMMMARLGGRPQYIDLKLTTK
jgi:hypothetical protein